MIGISSYERNVHVDEKTNIKERKNESGPFDRASVTIDPATALQ